MTKSIHVCGFIQQDGRGHRALVLTELKENSTDVDVGAMDFYNKINTIKISTQLKEKLNIYCGKNKLSRYTH